MCWNFVVNYIVLFFDFVIDSFVFHNSNLIMINIWKLPIWSVEPFIFYNYLYFQLCILLILNCFEILFQIYDFICPIFPLYLSFFVILVNSTNYKLVLNFFRERSVRNEQLLSLKWSFRIKLELDWVFRIPWSKLGNISHNKCAQIAMIKLVNFEY